MLTEVQCPKCQSKLRSPKDLTGKAIRCKKCDTRFNVGFQPFNGESIGDTLMISAAEIQLPPVPAPIKPVAKVPVKHILNQDDDLLVLDPLEKTVAKKAPAKSVPLPLPAQDAPTPAPAASAFAFDEAP